MSPNRATRRRSSAHNEAAAWKARHDALLTVLNAVLLAYGDSSPNHRLAVANVFYEGQRRRNVAVIRFDERVIVYLEDTNAIN